MKIAVALVFLFFIGCLIYYSGEEKTAQTNEKIDFILPDLAGTERQFSKWRGKIVILNFWATWCPPCVREIPLFVKLQQRWKNDGVQFVGLAIDDKDKVKKFAANLKINYPILLGEHKHIELSWQMGNIQSSFPYTVIFDQEGNILKARAGEVTQNIIEKAFAPLLIK